MKNYIMILCVFILVGIIVWDQLDITRLKGELNECKSTKSSSELKARYKEIKDKYETCHRYAMSQQFDKEYCEAEVSNLETQVQALIEACNRKDQQIQILSEK